MAEFSAPFAGSGGKIVSESEQRAYYSHLGDGIINARTRESGRLVTDGTSVLRLNPVEVKLQGLYYSLSGTPKAFNLASIGTQPAAGQSRIDLLVWRLDTSAKTIAAEVVSGLPSVTPVVPAFSRSGAVYEEDVWQWRWTGTGLQESQLLDRRTWVGPNLVLSPEAPLPSDADLGSTAYRGGFQWVRRLSGTVAGPAEWANVTSETLANRPRIVTGRWSGNTSSVGDAQLTRALGGVPTSMTVTPQGEDKFDGATPAQAYPFIRVLNNNGFVVRFMRRDTGRPLAINPVSFFYQITLQE